MKVKCGRNEILLNQNDVIFYNGVCYQITTRLIGSGWNTSVPVLSKTLANRLIKNGDLVLIKENLEYTTSAGVDMWYRYYKIKEVKE